MLERTKSLTPQQRAALIEKLQTGSGIHNQAGSASTVRRDTGIPLSMAQSAMWLHDRLNPGAATYNVNLCYRWNGVLDVEAFRMALRDLIQRHEVLRTRFVRNQQGRTEQQVLGDVEPSLEVLDFRDDADSDAFANAVSKLARLSRGAFDLEKGSLFRIYVARMRDESPILLLSLHHIICDGASVSMLLSELGTLYAGRRLQQAPRLPPLKAQYQDFATRQSEWLKSAEYAGQLNYWRQQLLGMPRTELFSQRQRTTERKGNGARFQLAMSKDAAAMLERFSKQEKVTNFVVLLAAIKALLKRHVPDEDIVVGVPFAGRVDPAFETLIGPFINPLPLRTSLQGDPTFRELVGLVKTTVVGALTHQQVPFDKLLEELKPHREPGQTPLFQILVNPFGTPTEIESFQELSSGPDLKDSLTVKFDLSIFIGVSAARPKINAYYNKDLFDAGFIEGLIEQCLRLLYEALEKPDVPISSYLQAPIALVREDLAARNQLRATIEQPEPPASASIADLFAQQAQSHASRLALNWEGRHWSYAELLSRTQAVSAYLSGKGASPKRVGLLGKNGGPMIAAMLGTLGAGDIFVPLDPLSPDERLAHVIRDASISIVLSASEFADRLRAGDLPVEVVEVEALLEAPRADARRDFLATSSDLAYLLFTSGSTGKPKGVVQSHGGAIHHANVYTRALGITPDDRLSLIAWYGFDAALMDIFGALLNGASLHIVNVREKGPAAVADLIHTAGLSIVHPTPTVFRYLLKSVSGTDNFKQVRAVVLGGEEALKSDLELFKSHFPPGAVLVNGLGPSESTTALQFFMNHATPVAGGGLPAGYPVDDTEIKVLNRSGQEVGVGATGELVIVSRGVAQGYWELPELTAKVFSDAADGTSRRVYRTGDMCRRLSSGAIEFSGRRDGQIKIRGQRIDLGEIESVLARHPGVKSCAVALTGTTPLSAESVLVAYWVPQAGGAQDAGLRDFLKEKLPAHMVPAEFCLLKEMPLLSNGKLDRKGLPPVSARKQAPQSRRPKLSTRTEQVVWDAWSVALKSEAFGVDDKFFDIGGHSLLVVEVCDLISWELKKRIELIEMFKFPTVGSLARNIDELLARNLLAAAD
ncbi:MAG: amino acid adenylation domain-containing protein [Burkholderiaceae bacterium]